MICFLVCSISPLELNVQRRTATKSEDPYQLYLAPPALFISTPHLAGVHGPVADSYPFGLVSAKRTRSSNHFSHKRRHRGSLYVGLSQSPPIREFCSHT